MIVKIPQFLKCCVCCLGHQFIFQSILCSGCKQVARKQATDVYARDNISTLLKK